VTSDLPIVEYIDEILGGPSAQPMAATTQTKTDVAVFLILDRIPKSKFWRVVAHEFGHVIGLPDLPTMKSVMSGSEVSGHPPVVAFDEADRVLCKAYRYCD